MRNDGIRETGNPGDPGTLGKLKEEIGRYLEEHAGILCDMSDEIFDDPELGFEEVRASKKLSDFLISQGFEVEVGYAGLATAFRAVWKHGEGGPNLGLLCEYDALPMGHACAHHLQGPSTIGAALAIKDLVKDKPFTLEVIGTPAEEVGDGGKTVMIANGAFRQHDVVLMMHGGDICTTDIKSIALSEFRVTYKGIASHAAIAPEKGRSALDAIMLAFSGIAYLRGHVADDTRMNMIIEDGGCVANAIVDHAVARVELRSYSRPYLDALIERAKKVFEGAALMTETTFELEKVGEMHNKIPVLSLNHLLMENAKTIGAREISPPREKTGATDFASVMYLVPGSCIRVAFVDRGVPSHSQGFLDKGKSGDAHEAMLTAAKIMAMTFADILERPDKLDEIKAEFARETQKLKEQR